MIDELISEKLLEFIKMSKMIPISNLNIERICFKYTSRHNILYEVGLYFKTIGNLLIRITAIVRLKASTSYL